MKELFYVKDIFAYSENISARNNKYIYIYNSDKSRILHLGEYIYLGRNISPTKSDVNIRTGKT